MSQLLTTAEAAFILSVHENTVRRWTERGLLTAHQGVPASDLRYTGEEVVRLFHQLRQSKRCEDEAQMSAA
jgi:DNA-binding transcriptional MerR regulator